MIGHMSQVATILRKHCGSVLKMTHFLKLKIYRASTHVSLPMQITLMGSDGRGHTFLAKPKDDLRKDHRMMEVVGVINRLCAREPASRRRNLYLRRC